MTHSNGLAIDGLKSAFEAIESTRKQLIENVEAQHIKTHETRERQRKLRALPIGLDDYSLYLKREIKRSADSFENEWRGSRKRNNQAHNQIAWSEYESSSVPILRGLFTEGLSLDQLCFFFPDVVHDRLMSSLRKNQSSPRGWGNEENPCAAERQKNLEKLEIEIEHLEEQKAVLQNQLSQINQALSQ